MDEQDTKLIKFPKNRFILFSNLVDSKESDEESEEYNVPETADKKYFWFGKDVIL